jgi:hypothetical protein
MNTEFAILLFWFGISVTANIGLTFAWLHARKRVRQLESRPVDLSHLDDLGARVENSFDALTARMDDLVSSQDFMNRVLTDRLDRLGRALPAPEPHDTPH